MYRVYHLGRLVASDRTARYELSFIVIFNQYYLFAVIFDGFVPLHRIF